MIFNKDVFFFPIGQFEPFLKSYIANFQYRSLVTSDFVEYIKHYFANTTAAGKLEKVDWETWFHAPGLPPVFAKYIRRVRVGFYLGFIFYYLYFCSYDDTLAKSCRDLCDRWTEWSSKGCPEPVPFSSGDLASFSSDQIQEFLAQLIQGPSLSIEAMKTMQQLYKFDAVDNNEVKFRCVKNPIDFHFLLASLLTRCFYFIKT